MDKIRIKGKGDLFGSINIPGSKNAALPIIISSLLSKKDLTIKNIPDLILRFGDKPISKNLNRFIDSNKNITHLITPFGLFNAQITRKWSNFDIYIGGENLGNYIQPNPIIDAANPFDEDFDGSLIWGPVMGRMFYGGIRYKLK